MRRGKEKKTVRCFERLTCNEFSFLNGCQMWWDNCESLGKICKSLEGFCIQILSQISFKFSLQCKETKTGNYKQCSMSMVYKRLLRISTCAFIQKENDFLSQMTGELIGHYMFYNTMIWLRNECMRFWYNSLPCQLKKDYLTLINLKCVGWEDF